MRYIEPAPERLEIYLQAGIHTFIDLTEAHELPHYADQLSELGMHHGSRIAHHRHGIVDRSVPESRAQMVLILDLIDEELESNRNVCVHCWGGVGRTGTVVGCHLVRHGMTGDEALSRIEKWWTKMEKRLRLPRSPETEEQRRFVSEWREHDI